MSEQFGLQPFGAQVAITAEVLGQSQNGLGLWVLTKSDGSTSESWMAFRNRSLIGSAN